MKITAFNGSPRGEKSNSHMLTENFLSGAREAGADTENIILIHENIEYCRGCFSCWFKTPGHCILKDGMDDLIEKYLSSDVICFVTPVYTWNMTAVLKNFVDRLIPLRCPAAIETNGKFDMKSRLVKLPDSVVIANSGFPGINNFGTIREVFTSCNPILEIYRNSGHLLKSDDAAVKARTQEYLDCVRQAGFELVRDGAVSAETKEMLKMELAGPDDYIKMMEL
jgi:Multimeric flavodoxin WrbA